MSDAHALPPPTQPEPTQPPEQKQPPAPLVHAPECGSSNGLRWPTPAAR